MNAGCQTMEMPLAWMEMLMNFSNGSASTMAMRMGGLGHAYAFMNMPRVVNHEHDRKVGDVQVRLERGRASRPR